MFDTCKETDYISEYTENLSTTASQVVSDFFLCISLLL